MSALSPDKCFNVAYELKKDEVYVGAVWIGVAIPCGLLLGALLSALVFRLCCKQWWKNHESSRVRACTFFFQYSNELCRTASLRWRLETTPLINVLPTDAVCHFHAARQRCDLIT